MNKYTIVLELELQEEMTNEEVKALLVEQWEQTPAAENGDLISVVNVCRTVK